MLLTYQPVDKQLNWELFDDEFPIPADELREVMSITPASCREIWNQLFTRDPSQVCMYQLPENHWTRRFDSYGPAWDRYVNDRTLPDNVAPFLQSVLPWDVADQVILIHADEYALATPLRIFLKHWPSFIAKNDDPVLLRRDSPEFVLFGDTGMLAIGHREL